MKKRSPKMSGFWDFLRKKTPEDKPGSILNFLSFKPQPPAEKLPAAPQQDKPSFMDMFRPAEEREERGLTLIPPALQLPAIFEFMTPSPAASPPAAEEVPTAQPWEMLRPSEEAAAAPSDVFGFLKPKVVFEERVPPASEWLYGEPPLWTLTSWSMPNTYEISDLVQQRLGHELPMIWEQILSNVDSSYWQNRVNESAHTGQPAEMEVFLISDSRDPYSDIFRFLGVPEQVIELYSKKGREGAERLTEEVLKPLAERVGKALDFLHPTPYLRGWFEIEPDEDYNFWLKYKEARFPQEG